MEPRLYLPEQHDHTPIRIIGCDELLDSEEVNQYELEDEDLSRSFN
jgi:hypothetical protein